jgi:hypothetical protein
MNWRAVSGLAAGLCACSPGWIRRDGDHEALRSAWWRAGDPDAIVLSNGALPCAFDDGSGDGPADPWRVEEARLELRTAMCREGAFHVLISLSRQGGPIEGTYEGVVGDAAPLDREAEVITLGVEESVLTSIDGWVRGSGVVEVDAAFDAAKGGLVKVDRAADDRLSGRVELPEVGVSASFEAAACPVGDALDLVLGGAFSCP